MARFFEAHFAEPMRNGGVVVPAKMSFERAGGNVAEFGYSTDPELTLEGDGFPTVCKGGIVRGVRGAGKNA